MKRTNDVNYRWATAARWAMAVLVWLFGCFIAGLMLRANDDIPEGVTAAVFIPAVAVFWLLKWAARREQSRRIDAAELQNSIGR